ncbi:MAG: efflux transporter periplasmic adaptor subunit [Moraxellaceae bacterium]|jgi:RND family efflux transporter MFP subunit|nr:efflux transporter periplasmic adaptor subunit [Moraxellaceae bacterium]
MNKAALLERLRKMPPKARWVASGAGCLLLAVLLYPRDSVSFMPAAPQGLELMPEDIATVRFAPLAGQLDFNGTLMPVRQMLLNARVAGEVTDVPVREGEAVAEGAILIRQDNRDMRSRLAQAEAAVQSVKAEHENAKEQVEKYRQLTDKNFFSRNDLNKATTQAAVLESQLRANLAQVSVAQKELESALLRAPFAGIVSERLVEPGQLVMPNTPLLRIVDLRELELAIQLPSAEIARVQKGQKVSFRADAFGTEEFTGTIVRLNPLAKASNRKITVYALVRNPDLRLRGGLFVHGRLQDANAAAGLVIPVTAVQARDGQSGVMVVRKQRLAWQPVTLGPRDERSGQVLVASGLVEGETVVATRVPLERAGAPVRFAEAVVGNTRSGG